MSSIFNKFFTDNYINVANHMKCTFYTHNLYNGLFCQSLMYVGSFLSHGCMDQGSRLALKYLAMNEMQGCKPKICNAFQLQRGTVWSNAERKYHLHLYNGKWVCIPVGSEESSATYQQPAYKMSPQRKLVVSITNEILQMKFRVVLRVFVCGALLLVIFLLSVAQKMLSLLAAAAAHQP